jgi:hypothetical protein
MGSKTDNPQREPIDDGRSRLDTEAVFQELLVRCRAHHDHLVALAEHVQVLVETARDEARRQAAQILDDARKQAATIVGNAEREARVAVDDHSSVVADTPEPVSTTDARETGIDPLANTQQESAMPSDATGHHVVSGADPRVVADESETGAGRAAPTASHHAGADQSLALFLSETRGAAAANSQDASPAPTPDERAAAREGPAQQQLSSFESQASSAAPKRHWWRRGSVAVGVAALVVAAAWMLQARVTSRGSPAAMDRNAHPSGIDAPASVPGTHANPVEPRTHTSGAGPQPAASARGPLTITVTARRAVWLRLNADGAQDAGRVLDAGAQRAVSAEREVTMRAGDAGAILMSVNGGPSQPFGPDGAVRTRRITRDPPIASDSGSHAALPAAAATSGEHGRGSQPNEMATQPEPARRSSPTDPAADADHQRQILAADRDWFDAHYRNDQSTAARLVTGDFRLVDERPAINPAGAIGTPERTVRNVRVDVWKDGAVVSGQMAERITTATGQHLRHSRFSEVWIRRAGHWQMMGLRLAADSSLPEVR